MGDKGKKDKQKKVKQKQKKLDQAARIVLAKKTGLAGIQGQ